MFVCSFLRVLVLTPCGRRSFICSLPFCPSYGGGAKQGTLGHGRRVLFFSPSHDLAFIWELDADLACPQICVTLEDSLQLGAPAVPVRSAQHLTRTIRLQDPTPNRCPAAAPRSGLTAQPAAAPASRRPGPRKHGEDRDGPSTEHRAKLDEEKLRLNIGGKKVEERISLASGSAGDRIPALHFLTDLPPSVWRFQTSHHRTGRGFHASEKADSAVGFVGTEPGRVAPCGRGNVIGETRVERRPGPQHRH